MVNPDGFENGNQTRMIHGVTLAWRKFIRMEPKDEAVAHPPLDEKVHKKFAFSSNVESEFLVGMHRGNAQNRACATAP